MDIRNFFGKPAKSASAAKKKKIIQKKPIDDDDSDATTDNEEVQPSAIVETTTTTKKNSIKKSTIKKTANNRVEIDASDFFATAAAAPSKKKTKPAPPPPPPPKEKDLWDDSTDEEVVVTKKKKRPSADSQSLEEEEPLKKSKRASKDDDDSTDESTNDKNDDDDDDETMDEDKEEEDDFKPDNDDDDDDDDDEDDDDDDIQPLKSKKNAKESDDDDDFRPKSRKRPAMETLSDDDDDDEPPVRKPTRPKVIKKEKTPVKKKASTPVKKTPPVKKRTPNKKAASSVTKKEALLRPTLSLDAFDTTTCAVSECLAGLTFCFTGVLETLGRDESADFIKILGGRVTTAVSGRTSYLVTGELLEDGRHHSDSSKYKTAMKNGTIVVKGEKELYGLCQLYHDRLKSRLGDSTNVQPPEEATSGASNAPPTSSSQPAANPYIKKENPYAKKANPYAKKSGNPYAKSKAATAAAPPPPSDRNALWADKYAPQGTHDVLGNGELVRKLGDWLGKWEKNFNNDKAYGKSFSAPNGPWKAALLSGPPGIGKTTSANLVAQEAGRSILEMNASDVRSKKMLESGLGDITGSHVINFGKKKDAKNATNKKAGFQKRCLIMDEVDGMGGSDRGGVAELIKMIKSSRIPIICICNDRQSTKLKSLAPHCMDLRFRRPVKTVIARRAIRIGTMEGMKIEQNAAEAIAESCGNDIRQVLNCLQMWKSNRTTGDTVTYKQLKDRERSINKDEMLRVSLFDATKLIIEGPKYRPDADGKTRNQSLFKRSDAFFVDYGMIGLNVQQNYLKVMLSAYQSTVRENDDDKIVTFVDRMCDAASTMSDFAVAENSLRGDQNWGLLPFIASQCVKTGYHAAGPTGSFFAGYPEFSAWLGKNSSRGKKNRLLQELSYHMNYKISTDKTDLRLHYVPALREQFAASLFHKDGAKIEDAIQLMDEYGLDRDDVMEGLDEFKMGKGQKFDELESKVKAALTKTYNQGSHKSQALVKEQGEQKVARKAKASKDPDAIGDDSDGDDGNNEPTAEELQKIFGKRKRATKKGGKTAGTKKKAKK